MDSIIQNPKMLFMFGVWSIFLLVFLRAFLRGKVVSKRSQQLWLVFFLCCVAFSFWGKNSELILDHFFGYRPVALLVKYISLISVAHLFFALLNDVKPNHALIRLNWLASVAITVGLFGFLAYIRYTPFPREDLRYLSIGMRDAVVMVYALVSFIPGALAMKHDETIRAMRVKLNLLILCSLSYMVTALGSVVAALLMLMQIGDPATAASAVQPFVVLGIVCFILIMIPYRWFLGLFHLRRFYTYQRLLGLEQRMLEQIGIASTTKIRISPFTQPRELELAIYRVIISVLDAYPALANDVNSYNLYINLCSCVETNPDYDDLVQRMARL